MITLINNNYEIPITDRMCMTGYSAYREGYEYEMDFADAFAPLDAPHWIPAGSTKCNFYGSCALSTIWISLSYPRVS